MAIRKNTRRFDPRYFMDEKTDVIKEEKDPFGSTRKVQATPQPVAAQPGPHDLSSTRKVPAKTAPPQQGANPAAVRASAQKIQATFTALQTQLKALFGALGEAKISFDHLIIETGNLEEGVVGAYKDVLGGVRSQTQGPIKVNWIEEEQKFLVVDGLHRLVEFIQNGETSCYCEINWYSGADGWLLPTKEERFENFSLNELERSMNGLAT
jgi:hypothetical protein